MQCVKGKCTSHFHKARSAGKERLRFALIMLGLGVTLVALYQTIWMDPTLKVRSGPSTLLALCPGLHPSV